MDNIIVIGGTSGLGYSTGLRLAEKGHNVILAGRSKPKNLGKCLYKSIDVTSESSVKDFFLGKEIKHIDALIYSAGISSKRKSIADFNQASYEKVHDVNVLGALLTFKYSFKYLKKSKGKVVVINSIAGRSFSKHSGIEYTVTKNGLSGVVKHLAMDWAQDGILINSIFPSMLDTPMLRKALSKKKIEDIL